MAALPPSLRGVPPGTHPPGVPETAKTILARLAEVYEERREWEKAYALVRQMGNPEALAGLVERVGDQVLLSEQPHHAPVLAGWTSRLRCSKNDPPCSR